MFNSSIGGKVDLWAGPSSLNVYLGVVGPLQVVVGMVYFNDPPSCTGSSIVTGMAFHPRQVGGEKRDEEAIQLGVGLTVLPCKT
jgi:hypothetical protein